jgi:hypothetical protein
MTYVQSSFFSPLGSPIPVSQVAKTMQPEGNFTISVRNPKGTERFGQGAEIFLMIAFITSILVVGVLTGMAIEEYLEERRQRIQN